MVNPIDISPNHAGTITGIVNCFSTIFSILGPLSVDFFGSDKVSKEKIFNFFLIKLCMQKDTTLWWNVFRLAAGIYIFCGIFYAVFSSGTIQTWNDSKEVEDKSKTNKNKQKL